MSEKKTVLLVDDEKHIVAQVYSFFKSVPSYQLMVTTNPSNVKSVLEGAKIELIITDLRMPNISGYDIIKMTKDLKKDIPFLVITAYMKEEAPQLKELGIADGDIIVKPFEPEVLEKKIREKLNIGGAFEHPEDETITNNGKIIFIDDEKELAEVFQETFEEEGFSVDIFGNGKDALDHLRKHPDDYHVALVDIALPGGINGYEIIKELQKINPKIGIVPISAHYPEEIKEKLQEIGFDPKKFMKKPFDDVPGLMELVREYAAKLGAYKKF